MRSLASHNPATLRSIPRARWIVAIIALMSIETLAGAVGDGADEPDATVESHVEPTADPTSTPIPPTSTPPGPPATR